MIRPAVGVIGNFRVVESRFPTQQVSEKYLEAVTEVAGAMPLMFASAPRFTEIQSLLDAVDGILLTGGRTNVHPTHFNAEPHASYEPYDEGRDAVAIALARACVARDVPLFGICRGMQEISVAFGASLHPEIRDLPGRINHRMPRLENGDIHPDPAVVYADRHTVSLMPGGTFATIFGTATIRVNSLHGQGILEPGPRVLVEGLAEDGTPEAIRIPEASGFALGVQWHAEFDAAVNPVNRALFSAFGAAVAERHERRRGMVQATVTAPSAVSA